jgi:hypothetical protein
MKTLVEVSLPLGLADVGLCAFSMFGGWGEWTEPSDREGEDDEEGKADEEGDEGRQRGSNSLVVVMGGCFNGRRAFQHARPLGWLVLRDAAYLWTFPMASGKPMVFSGCAGIGMCPARPMAPAV